MSLLERLPSALVHRLAGPLLVLATLLVYWPALNAGYIWDDDYYLTENAVLREPGGFWRLWVPGVTVQYYPLVFSSFWLEYRMFGAAPFGYHCSNVLLHAGNAWLVALLARRIALPWPWAIAGLFALHPVHVESVAWITERKNVLSGFFYLLAAHAYVGFDEARVAGRPAMARYILATLGFVAALLSKSVTCSLPAALLLLFAWRRQPLDWRRVRPLLPWFVIGLLLALHTAALERSRVGAIGPDFDFSAAERLLIAGNAVPFYLQKLAWPWPLMFFYPRWELQAEQPSAWLPVIACGCFAVFATWWFARGRRGLPLAMAYFVGTLLPALGFFNVYPMLYSFVADHFQYLASLGPFCLLAAAGSLLAQRQRWPVIAMAVLCAVLGGLTAHRCLAFRDAETLWLDTLAKNPRAWIAHNNLAVIETDRGEFAVAADRLRTALAMTSSEKAQRRLRLNLGRVLAKEGRYDEEHAVYAELQQELGGVEARLARALERLGRDEEAQQYYELAVADPAQLEAPLWYAQHWLRRGEPKQAIPWLQQHLQSSRAKAAEFLWLVEAQLAIGQLDAAATAIARGAKLAQQQGDAATLHALQLAQRRLPRAR